MSYCTFSSVLAFEKFYAAAKANAYAASWSCCLTIFEKMWKKIHKTHTRKKSQVHTHTYSQTHHSHPHIHTHTVAYTASSYCCSAVEYMHIYIYVYICIHMYMCMYINIYTYLSIYQSIYLSTYLYIHMYICVYMYINVYMYTNVYILYIWELPERCVIFAHVHQQHRTICTLGFCCDFCFLLCIVVYIMMCFLGW